MRHFALALAALCVVASPVGRASTTERQSPSVDQLLERVGRYVNAFLAEAANIVAEEDYLQRATTASSTATRRLKSDLAIMLDDRAGWLAFRDVFEVDGRPVRDREDRLVRLFAQPSVDAMERARQIVAESARFNLNPRGVQIPRTINVPVTALKFLLPANQRRSTFRLDLTSREGRQVARLRFTERATPRIVSSSSNAAATGDVLVELDTGAVLQTEFSVTETVLETSLRTTYAVQAPFRALMPKSMEENYVGPMSREQMGGWRVEGRAVYGNFRSFGVSVGSVLKAAE